MFILLFLLALVFFAAGGALAFLGDKYGGPQGLSDSGSTRETLDSQASEAIIAAYRQSPLWQDDVLAFNSSGLSFLIPAGGVFVLLGVVFIILSVKSFRKRPKKKAVEEEAPKTIKVGKKQAEEAPSAEVEEAPAPAAAPAAPAAAPAPAPAPAAEAEDEAINAAAAAAAAAAVAETAKPKAVEIDMDLGDAPGPAATPAGGQKKVYTKFDVIESVVAMSQANVTPQLFMETVQAVHPDFGPHVNKVSESAQKVICRQMLQCHAMRLKRGDKDINPNQYYLQDKRMSEAERETICRRFLPRNPSALNPAGVKIIGEVYTLNEQQKKQQETQTEVEDWQDISLRTFVSVMEQPTSTS